MRYALASFAGAAMLSCAGTAVAEPGVRIHPSFDLRQVVSRGPYQSEEFVTYSEAAVGADGTIDTRRVKASFNYQYARRFGGNGTLNQKTRQTAFARADIDVIDDRLSVALGGYAALLNRDFRGEVSFNPDQINANLAQTYSVYAAPSYHQPFEFAELDLTYRIGFTDVSDGASALQGGIPGGPTVPGGVPGGVAADIGFGRVSSSVNQSLTARFGNREQSSRLRWDFIGTATHEDSDRLNQRYRSYDGRFEVEYAVRRGIGIIANAGYERTRSTQAEILRDPLTSAPILGANGDFLTDPSGARREVFGQNGLNYEAGLRLQPTRRTILNVRAGKRFGMFTINGDGRWEITPRIMLTGRVVQGVDSFGRLLTRDIDGVAVRTIVNNNQTEGLNGCLFGTDPGTGTCLFNATQSITAATFRNRSAQATLDYRRGRTSMSLSGIYSKRTFLDSDQIRDPSSTLVDGSFDGGSDTSMTLNAQLGQALRGGMSVSGGLFASRFEYALSSNRRDYYVGGTGSFSVALGRRLSGQVAGTVSRRYSDVAPRLSDGTLSAGLRYQF